MAAKTLADLITITDVAPGTVGMGNLRTTPDQRITAEPTFDSHWREVPKHFVRCGANWAEICGRCGDKGNVGYGPHNGVCYGCNGSGTHGGTYTQAELDAKLLRWGRRAAAENAKAAEKAAAVRAIREAWIAANGDLIAWALSLTPTGIQEGVDSYTRIEETRELAETPERTDEGWTLHRSEQMEDGRWWAHFVLHAPEFKEFGREAESMITMVRCGGALDKRATSYLTKVMTNAPAKQAARAAEEAARAEATRHSGTPGTRMEITGNVILAEVRGDGTNPYMMIKVQGTGDHTGLTWVTFSSGRSAWKVRQGQTVTVKATIKRNDVFRGAKSDQVNRAAFTILDDQAAPADTTPAPAPQPEAAPAPQQTTTEKAASRPLPAAQAPARPTVKATLRKSLGESLAPGWELLYDKPRKGAQVVRRGTSYGLVCAEHKTVHPMARLSDDRALLRDGGWCCH